MKKPDAFEQEILAAYEKGELKSTSPSRAKLAKFKAAASATFLKEKRINIRISTPDLMDIQDRPLEEGMPYQTLIASVLHKYVRALCGAVVQPLNPFRYTQVGIQGLSAPADTAKSLIHKDSRNPQLSHCSILCRS